MPRIRTKRIKPLLGPFRNEERLVLPGTPRAGTWPAVDLFLGSRLFGKGRKTCK